MTEELEEQLVLGRGEGDLARAAAGAARSGVEREVAEAQDLALARLPASKQRTDARGEHLEREWLHEVVVGARVEPDDLVGGGVLRRQHEDRELWIAGAQPSADLNAVDARHHQVEHHEVGRELERLLERFRTVARGGDRVALERERAAQHVRDVLVVVDDENPAWAGAVRRERGLDVGRHHYQRYGCLPLRGRVHAALGSRVEGHFRAPAIAASWLGAADPLIVRSARHKLTASWPR